MALSGSYDSSLTARQVITYALQKCNIVGMGQAPSADAAEGARIALNLMLKDWSTKGPHLWKKTETSVTLVASTVSYSLASANALRVISMRYRNASSIDLPMTEMTREEYYNLPNKSSTGVPVQFYQDPQRSALTVYIWQALASVTTEALQITIQKKFDDIDSLDDDIDVPQEWLLTVGYNLASLLLDDYPIDGKEADRIIARAEVLKGEAMDYDREATLCFVPGEY